MGKPKKSAGQQEGFSKFDGFGVDFKCKLIGFTNVEAARGDDICQAALNKLKVQALRNNKEKKEHKQRITVNITLKGIRLLDETTERIDHAHPIHRISFISHDNDDKRTFGYIVGTKEGYKLFAIKSMKEAEQITKTLKELFQEVFEMYQAKKNGDQGENATIEKTEQAEQVKESEEKPAEIEKSDGTILDLSGEATYEVPTDATMDWGQLNEQIQVMQSGTVPTSTSFDIFNDAGNESNVSSNDPFGGNNFASTAITKQDDGFGDLYATVDKKKQQDPELDFFTSPPSENKPVKDDDGETSLLMNDPFADLKKNINELHKQNQMQQQQQQQAFGFSDGFHQHPQQTNIGYINQNNPFAGQQLFPQQLQQPLSGYQQPVIPPRPAISNPFMASSAPAPQENHGWTVDKPISAPRKEQTLIISSNSSDPFAFLDNQTGGQNGKVSNAPTNHQSFTTPTTNASNELLDFLG